MNRVRVVFRLHRALKREAEVRWARVTPQLLDDGDAEDVYLKTLDGHSLPMDVVRENPFFLCYEVSLERIRRGYDLLVLF